MKPDNSLFYKYLLSITKSEINHIRRLFKCDVPSNLNKQEMALGVADYILNESEYWMRMLPSAEIQIIDELLQHKPGYKFSAGFLPYVPIIEEYGIVTVECDEGDNRCYSVDADMHKAFKCGFQNTIAFMVAKDILPYELITRGVYNLYGVVPFDVLYDILKRAEPGISAETGYYSTQPSYLIFFSESLLLSNYFLDCNRRPYYYNPSIDDPAYFIEEQNARSGMDYKGYTIEEFKSAGKNPPFCSVGSELKASKALLKMYEKYAGDIFDEVIDYDRLYSLAQVGIPGIIDMVTEELRFPSIIAVNEFVGYVNEFSNHIPHWALKGWSPDEVFIKFEKPFFNQFPKMASLNRLENWESKMNADAMEKAFSMTKVGRNDPCPCGSGKKYKECHGKYQS